MEETEVWHQAVCCQSTQTAITESHRMGLLNNTFIFSQFWRLESLRSVLQQRVVSGEASLQDLRIATFSMDPPTAERGSVLYSVPSEKDTNPIRPGAALLGSLRLNYLLPPDLQTRSHWRHLKFEGTQFSPDKNKTNKIDKNKLNKQINKNSCKISTRVAQLILWEKKKKVGKRTG